MAQRENILLIAAFLQPSSSQINFPQWQISLMSIKILIGLESEQERLLKLMVSETNLIIAFKIRQREPFIKNIYLQVAK